MKKLLPQPGVLALVLLIANLFFVNTAFGQATATVQTDKADYSPGDIVTITGSGWDGGESVSLHIVSDCGCTNVTLTAVADENGNISNSEFVIQEYHLGASFTLEATGELSGKTAQTTFTDADNVYPSGISVSPTSSQTRCQGGVANTLSATITTCQFNQGPPGPTVFIPITYTWYYNSTNTNVISVSTVTVQTSSSLTTSTTTNTFLPSTSATGTRFYFCQVTYTPRNSGNACGGSGVSGFPFTTSPVQVTVIAQPVNPTLNVKTPNLASVCTGQDVSATFNAGTGGVGCTDDFEYSTNGGGSWSAYTAGTNISTTGLAGNTVKIRGRHDNCTVGSGCTATYDELASWTVVAQPVNPTLNVKTPNLASVCAGQDVSATFNAGSGGVGCTDDFEYSTNGGGSWSAYTAGTNISTTGLTGNTIKIRGRHDNCSANTGCNATYNELASWDVVAQPVNPTLSVKTPNLASVCDGQDVNATFNAGSGGVGCSDDFEYSTNGGGSWLPYTPGNNISTTGLAGNTVKIRGRHDNCSASSGCTASYDELASWTVVAQPVNPTLNVKTPNLNSVCDGKDVSATFNVGSGGIGCSDDFEYSTNGGGSWSSYTPGTNISTIGLTGNTVKIRGRHNNCTANTGCTAMYDELASWTVVAQPVNPTLNAKTPNLTSVCDGQDVSATFNAGSGGIGCSDDFEYSTNGGGSWSPYTPGINISTTGLAGNTVKIRGRHNNCTVNSGCTVTYDELASWTVVAQPVNPTLNAKTPNLISVCDGQNVSATFNAGSGGVGCSDDFEYSTNGGGSWSPYTPGTDISTTGVAGNTIKIRGRHNNCTVNSGCTATYDELASWTVVAQPVNPTLNLMTPAASTVCEGTNVKATFNPGSGGIGCTDDFEYSTNGGTTWTAYTPGTYINTSSLGGGTVMIHGRHNNCTLNSGCTANYVTLATWNINDNPTFTAPASTNLGSVQYSDPVNATITVTDDGAGSSLTASTQWKVGAGSFTSGLPTNLSLVVSSTASNSKSWTLGGNVNVAAGNYTIRVTVSDGQCSSYIDLTLTITCEDARAYYTGVCNAATSSPTSSNAIVTLTATIKDISAVTGDPAYDAYAGDIRNAKVYFYIVEKNLTFGPFTPGLVNSGDTKTGTVSYNWNVAIAGDYETFTINIQVKNNDYYCNGSGDDGVVNVYKPVPGEFITGGGYIVLANSAGAKAGTAGTHNNFGFNAKNEGNKPKGNINTIIRKLESDGLHIYQVKGNSLLSLAVNPACPKTATFTTKANITDITNPLAPYSVPGSGNSTLVLKMTDAGEPGSSDKIAITVLNSAGGLWYSSSWDGTKTVEQLLGGGNLKVHGGVGCPNSELNNESIVSSRAEALRNLVPFSVKAYPNPSEHYFNLRVEGNTNEKVQLKVFDIVGRQVYTTTGSANQTYRFGEKFMNGTYLVEVRQGDKRSVIKLVKQ